MSRGGTERGPDAERRTSAARPTDADRLIGPELVSGPVLGIETSGSLTGAALFVRGRLVGESALDAHASSQELLVDQIRRLLDAHGLSPSDLSRIGVALGPGSFTGIRVGLSAARGIALGAGIPLAGVPSHEALAWPYRDFDAEIILLTGFRREEVFLEAGRWMGSTWSASLPGASVSVASVEERLAALPPTGLRVLAGESVAQLAREHPALLALGACVHDPLAWARRPAVIACLAARADAPLWAGPELDRSQPLYLRGADAKRPVLRAGSLRPPTESA